MPGGSTSNIFTYFSRGDLALSVTMTTFSTLAALVMTPLALFIYGSRFMTSEISVGMGSVIGGLAVMLVPVLIGMFIRKRNANVGAILELIGGVLGVLIIVALIVLWVPRNGYLLATTPWQVYAAATVIGLGGFLFGFLTSISSGMGFRRAATVSLETGIQNGPLALSVVLLSFSGELANQLVLIPVLYSLFIVILSAGVTMIYRWQNGLRRQDVRALL
jgi:predicted Na+-dependent transporter